MSTKTIVIIILSAFGCLSCVSDKPDVKPNTPISANAGTGVFITNEGNFNGGNASVSYYNFSDGAVTEDVFEAANHRSLGDVCQSMEIFEEKAYLVVNESGRIEIVNPKDFTSLGTITGLGTPRYFLGVNSSKAYVTDIYTNSVSVINLSSNTKVKDIKCSGSTEELILVNGEAFVTNTSKEYLYVISTSSDLVEDSIKLGFGSNSIKEDKNGKLWVLCGGNGSNKAGSLHRIDPVNKQVEMSLTLSNASQVPYKLKINGTRDTLYYLNSGVYQFPIANAILPSAPLISQGSYLFYGLGVDPHSGTIYVSDAIDYVQKGKVYRYKPDASFVGTFKVGIIPGDFYFY